LAIRAILDSGFMAIYSDEQLIEKFLKGDEKSLEVLIKRYLKPIYSFVYRNVGNIQSAEDITQEIFIRMWRNIKRFDHKKKFKTWLFVIAKNASIDFLRKKKTISFSDIEIPVASPVLSDEFSLNCIIKKLPPEYRKILSLHYKNLFTFREIAEIFNESINTIKSRHLRALSQLKKFLSKS